MILIKGQILSICITNSKEKTRFSKQLAKYSEWWTNLEFWQQFVSTNNHRYSRTNSLIWLVWYVIYNFIITLFGTSKKQNPSKINISIVLSSEFIICQSPTVNDEVIWYIKLLSPYSVKPYLRSRRLDSYLPCFPRELSNRRWSRKH